MMFLQFLISLLSTSDSRDANIFTDCVWSGEQIFTVTGQEFHQPSDCCQFPACITTKNQSISEACAVRSTVSPPPGPGQDRVKVCRSFWPKKSAWQPRTVMWGEAGLVWGPRGQQSFVLIGGRLVGGGGWWSGDNLLSSVFITTIDMTHCFSRHDNFNGCNA